MHSIGKYLLWFVAFTLFFHLMAWQYGPSEKWVIVEYAQIVLALLSLITLVSEANRESVQFTLPWKQEILDHQLRGARADATREREYVDLWRERFIKGNAPTEEIARLDEVIHGIDAVLLSLSSVSYDQQWEPPVFPKRLLDPDEKSYILKAVQRLQYNIENVKWASDQLRAHGKKMSNHSLLETMLRRSAPMLLVVSLAMATTLVSMRNSGLFEF